MKFTVTVLCTLVLLEPTSYGQQPSAAVFPGGHTHTNVAGAELNAKSVVEGKRSLKIARSQVTFGNKIKSPIPTKFFILWREGGVRCAGNDEANRPLIRLQSL